MQTKKIAIVGIVGIPAKYGGFETLVEYLISHLSSEYEFTVYCSSKSYESKLESYNGAKLQYIGFDANGAQSIPYDVVSMLKALRYADTLLILGVSGCFFLPFIKLISGKKVIVHIDGLEWKRHKWKKYAKWFLRVSEMIAIQYADVVIADNKVIQEYIQSDYGKSSELITYGADHVTKEAITDETYSQYPLIAQKYAFKVCRIEPENNVHLILKAFAKHKKYNLFIIGNWQMSDYGKQLVARYGHVENISLLDPIYDQSVLNQFRSNCDIYIHGHSAGGTNPSLVEAMYLGLPIFAYDVAYNRETTHYEAKYFKSCEELIAHLENLDYLNLGQIGRDMKKIAHKNYTWRQIAEKYSNVF